MSLTPVDWLDIHQAQHSDKQGRTLVTLAYAQSLDESLTLSKGEPTPISGVESMKITHQLRAKHDGILVGIGTVLADNPRLNVRLVDGEDPQPVILDSHLRFPADARMLGGKKKPILFCREDVPVSKENVLTQDGLTVQRSPYLPEGLHLKAVLTNLYQKGIRTLMVEGGVSVLRAFLLTDLWDMAIITIAPLWLGGYGGIAPKETKIMLNNRFIYQAGADVVLAGTRI